MTLLTNDVVLPGERHTLTSRDEAMAGNLHNLLSAGTLEGFSGKFAEEDDLFDDEGEVRFLVVTSVSIIVISLSATRQAQ